MDGENLFEYLSFVVRIPPSGDQTSFNLGISLVFLVFHSSRTKGRGVDVMSSILPNMEIGSQALPVSLMGNNIAISASY